MSGTRGLAWAQTIVARGFFVGTGPSSDSFTATALHVGDAVVVHTFCQASSEPMVTLAASGWTFQQLGALAGTPVSAFWATEFAAIAPTIAPTTVTATWTVMNGCNFMTELGDEFTGNDPTGGSATFDDYVAQTSTGDCTATLVTHHADDAVWAACNVTSANAAGAVTRRAATTRTVTGRNGR